MQALGGSPIGRNPMAPPVTDKSEIYAYAKNNDLQNTAREQAMNVLLSKFSNPQEELETILDDVVMSNDPSQLETIDKKYNYQDTMAFERSFDKISHLNNAWKEMESNELKDL
jgi:hypothetical protein